MLGDKSAAPDLAGLQEFIMSDAGDAPPALVGRDTIITDIESKAQEIWKRYSANRDCPDLPGKVLRTISGPPGAGKTSVFKHLRNKWRREAVGTSRASSRQSSVSPAPIPVYFSAAADFESVESVVKKLGNALQPRFGSSLVGHQVATADHVGASYLASAGRTTTRQELPIKAPVDHVVARWTGVWMRPMVMMIDEFQNIGGRKGPCTPRFWKSCTKRVTSCRFCRWRPGCPTRRSGRSSSA